jgi:Uma2 family endonuclease
MATVDDRKTQDSPDPPRAPRLRRSGRYRWTVEQFYWLDRMGLFEDRHVELLEGEIYEMTINPPHAASTGITRNTLQAVFGAGHCAREQKPLDIGRKTMPEPDVAVCVGSERDYTRTHPRRALLVVEVSDTTLRKDRKIKGHIYAHAGITDYWIVNLVDRQLEICRNPGPDPDRKGRYRYAEVTIVPADGFASPLARPNARVAVADLLP